MYILRFLLCSIAVILSSVVSAQSEQREFEMKEGDTTYVMKKYFMVFLNAGSNRNQDSATTQRIQMAHLNHLDSLAQAGFITMVGPFGDDKSLRGIAIYDVDSAEEARRLAESDPAVKAKRLTVEVRPWWCAKGSKLK